MLTIRLVLLLVPIVFSGAAYSSQAQQESVRVKTNQHSENPPQADKKPNPSEKSSPLVLSNISAEKKSDNHAADGRDEGTEFWPPLYGYRLKVSDTLLVAFTAFLFIATLFLYRATKELVIGAEDASQKELRAYMCLEDIVYKRPSRSDHPGIVLEIKNFGSTPARHVHFSFWHADDAPVLKPTLPHTVRPKYIGTMAPGQSYIQDRPPVSDGRFSESVWLIGRIYYEDIFENWWSFTFCYQCLILGGNILDSMYEKWNDEEDHGKCRPDEIADMVPLIPGPTSSGPVK